jgi:hypothetical protein
MLQTLIELVIARDKLVTQYTKFMLEMMKESESIEEAMSKILRRADFIAKIVR